MFVGMSCLTVYAAAYGGVLDDAKVDGRAGYVLPVFLTQRIILRSDPH